MDMGRLTLPQLPDQKLPELKPLTLPDLPETPRTGTPVFPELPAPPLGGGENGNGKRAKALHPSPAPRHQQTNPRKVSK